MYSQAYACYVQVGDSSFWRFVAPLSGPKAASSHLFMGPRLWQRYKCPTTTNNVFPLQRIWCLFEVYQTILLSRNSSDGFQGLLLCTSAGVLQQGNAGTDVVVAVAKKVAELDTENATASDESDRLMIHSLIASMDGGFDYMNTFVRNTICKALEASHSHYETTLKTLMENLTGRVSVPAEALPTLLTSRAPQPENKSGS